MNIINFVERPFELVERNKQLLLLFLHTSSSAETQFYDSILHLFECKTQNVYKKVIAPLHKCVLELHSHMKEIKERMNCKISVT